MWLHHIRPTYTIRSCSSKFKVFVTLVYYVCRLLLLTTSGFSLQLILMEHHILIPFHFCPHQFSVSRNNSVKHLAHGQKRLLYWLLTPEIWLTYAHLFLLRAVIVISLSFQGRPPACSSLCRGGMKNNVEGPCNVHCLLPPRRPPPAKLHDQDLSCILL